MNTEEYLKEMTIKFDALHELEAERCRINQAISAQKLAILQADNACADWMMQVSGYRVGQVLVSKAGEGIVIGHRTKYYRCNNGKSERVMCEVLVGDIKKDGKATKRDNYSKNRILFTDRPYNEEGKVMVFTNREWSDYWEEHFD